MNNPGPLAELARLQAENKELRRVLALRDSAITGLRDELAAIPDIAQRKAMVAYYRGKAEAYVRLAQDFESWRRYAAAALTGLCAKPQSQRLQSVTDCAAEAASAADDMLKQQRARFPEQEL